MKNVKISILIALAFIFSISSCKKKDDNPTPLKTFSFNTASDLTVELSWTVNGEADGHNYVDLDFFIDNEVTQPSYIIDYRSTNDDLIESINFPTSADNKTYYIGFIYCGNMGKISKLTAPYTIKYTIKVYAPSYPNDAQTFTGTLKTPDASPDIYKIYNQMLLVKSASDFTFTEIRPKTTFIAPYFL